MDYLAVYEEGRKGWSAYLPDIDGVFATGRTRKEVEQRILEAAQAHVEWLLREGDSVPEPTFHAGTINIIVDQAVPA